MEIISDKIDSEIRLLESSNEAQLNRDEVNIKKTLEFNMQELYSLGSPHFDHKLSSLRKALNFDSGHFMEDIVQKHNQTIMDNKAHNRSNKFKVYQSTHH